MKPLRASEEPTPRAFAIDADIVASQAISLSVVVRPPLVRGLFTAFPRGALYPIEIQCFGNRERGFVVFSGPPPRYAEPHDQVDALHTVLANLAQAFARFAYEHPDATEVELRSFGRHIVPEPD